MTNIASRNFSSVMPTNSFPYVPGKALSAVFTPPTQAPTETVTLSAQAQEPNLYEGLSNSTTSVKVGVWGKSENGCIEDILVNQGYSRKEIYTKDPEGQNMLQRVAQANNLKDPNVVAEGFDLNVPTKLTESDTSQEANTYEDKATEAPQGAEACDDSAAQPNDSKEHKALYVNLKKNIFIEVLGDDPSAHAEAYAKAFGDDDETHEHEHEHEHGHSYENNDNSNNYNYSNPFTYTSNHNHNHAHNHDHNEAHSQDESADADYDYDYDDGSSVDE